MWEIKEEMERISDILQSQKTLVMRARLLVGADRSYEGRQLIGAKLSNHNEISKAVRDRRNAQGLLVAAILLFIAPVVVSAIFYAQSRDETLDSPLERGVGTNVSDYLEQQLVQNGTIDTLQMMLLNLEMQLANLNTTGSPNVTVVSGGDGGLSFLNASFTPYLVCPVRFGSNCGTPSLTYTTMGGYSSFPAGNSGILTLARMQTAHVEFFYASFGNWSNDLTLTSGTPCSLTIMVDTVCWPSGYTVPCPGGTCIRFNSYRSNPVADSPPVVLMLVDFELTYTAFHFYDVLVGGTRPVTLPMTDIHMILSTII